MSSTIIITNKKTGQKYAYDSVSYRDPVTKKPKSKRTYLGRVDPITGAIIPKASKGKRNREPAADWAASIPESLKNQLLQKDELISALRESLDWYKRKSQADDKLIHQFIESAKVHEEKWFAPE